MADYRLRAEAGRFEVKGGDVKMTVMGPVRDARLAELQFLAELERHRDGWTFDPSRKTEEAHFGLGLPAFKEMILELLLDSSLNHAADALNPMHRAMWLQALKSGQPSNALLQDVGNLTGGKHVTLRINHRGRLRLWRLRDELRADRGRDEWGILYDRRAWERELAV